MTKVFIAHMSLCDCVEALGTSAEEGVHEILTAPGGQEEFNRLGSFITHFFPLSVVLG